MATATATKEKPAEQPGLGHNKPPVLIDTETLARTHAASEASVASVLEQARGAPASVTNDDDQGKVADVIKEISNTRKAVDSTRVAVKAPFLAAERVVESFFKGMIDRLDKASAVLSSRNTSYLVAKRNAEAEKRAKEAREAAERAARERAELQAAAELDAVDRDQVQAAHQAQEESRQATEAAAAPAADMARTRSESGKTLSTLATVWKFEVIDLDAIPLDQLRPYIPRPDIEKAVRAYVRVHKGGRPLAGVKIFEDYEGRVL